MWCSYFTFRLILFFFCKQKTAYEMRISDWSSDVCSSDLTERPTQKRRRRAPSSGAANPPAMSSPSTSARPAMSAHAAVDPDHLAIDVAGGVRTQETDQRGDFLRATGATGRHGLLDELRRERLVGHPPLDHPRPIGRAHV